MVRQAAKQLVENIKKDIRPRDIVTKEAIDDAFALDMAMGGSTNTVLHTLDVYKRQAQHLPDVAKLTRESSTDGNIKSLVDNGQLKGVVKDGKGLSLIHI